MYVCSNSEMNTLKMIQLVVCKVQAPTAHINCSVNREVARIIVVVVEVYECKEHLYKRIQKR
jgi:hypothetical protein